MSNKITKSKWPYGTVVVDFDGETVMLLGLSLGDYTVGLRLKWLGCAIKPDRREIITSLIDGYSMGENRYAVQRDE